MRNNNDTQFFKVVPDLRREASEILDLVYEALKEKGYDPISQIVGYIMSGDPTYITSYNNARSLIIKVERDEILEELLKVYISERLEK